MPLAREVIIGDITTLGVEAVVNAANAALSGGGGVDGAIHRAAGPELLAACRALGRCPPGDARRTRGFALAPWIIHAVGPVWSGGDRGEDVLLAGCYRRSLELAGEVGARSIAFPCISTGAYRFPHERAAQIAVDATRSGAAWAMPPALERVIFCCFDAADARIYERLLAAG